MDKRFSFKFFSVLILLVIVASIPVLSQKSAKNQTKIPATKGSPVKSVKAPSSLLPSRLKDLLPSSRLPSSPTPPTPPPPTPLLENPISTVSPLSSPSSSPLSSPLSNPPSSPPSSLPPSSLSPLINGGCPYPLISLRTTTLSETDTSFCPNGCCLPCPIANNFYKEHEIDLIFRILSVVRIISFICTLIIVVSYIVLPNKREHPAITVLCFNISLLIFTSVTFFYMGDIRKVQCADSISQATMKNNALCGVQGIVVIFSSYLLILWCLLLILHLHFETVWRSNVVQKYHIISQILVIATSVTVTILPAVMGKISFEFGAVCLISSDLDNKLFWYPLAAIVILGFVIHFCTFLYIGKSQCVMSIGYRDSEECSTSSRVLSNVTNVTGQEIVRAIKIQWRALMLALVLLITYLLYWTYVQIEVDKIRPKHFDPPQPWFLSWLKCISENGFISTNAQNICSSHAKGHIPKIPFLVISETATATLGISIFIVFGTSIDLWSEWRLYFAKKFSSVSSNSYEGTWV